METCGPLLGPEGLTDSRTQVLSHLLNAPLGSIHLAVLEWLAVFFSCFIWDFGCEYAVS